ncbi:MAG: FliI/YscN family ATPase [Deltaproteobacteria bacterium]
MERRSTLIERCARARAHDPVGVVQDVVGMVVEVGGLRAAVGQTLEVQTEHGEQLELEVVGFRSDRLLASPLGSLSGLHSGALARLSDRGSTIGVGPELLGRVFDAFGNPLDEGPPPELAQRYPIHRAPPPAFGRKPVAEVFSTGVRAVDSMLTLGVGQRLGIFAGAGVGKSTLLGMICRSSQADVNVVGLVGERGREVSDFVRNSLGADGLARTVVLAATSDQPPLVRAHGAEAATSVAEYFRDQGKSVLLVMDSVTRYAMALRETALSAGEPPATKGYPPSVFAALPRLLERAGTSIGAGVITGLYTVFVEGDDLSDPVADAVRGILDGHIVLSRALAEKGHFPAIDVLQSISRLAPDVTDATQQSSSGLLREALGTYRDAADLIQVGAYVPGSDPRIDNALTLVPKINAFLRQGLTERTPFGQSKARMQALLSHLPRS